jgi:hypothetical protein
MSEKKRCYVCSQKIDIPAWKEVCGNGYCLKMNKMFKRSLRLGLTKNEAYKQLRKVISEIRRLDKREEHLRVMLQLHKNRSEFGWA